MHLHIHHLITDACVHMDVCVVTRWVLAHTFAMLYSDVISHYHPYQGEPPLGNILTDLQKAIHTAMWRVCTTKRWTTDFRVQSLRKCSTFDPCYTMLAGSHRKNSALCNHTHQSTFTLTEMKCNQHCCVAIHIRGNIKGSCGGHLVPCILFS